MEDKFSNYPIITDFVTKRPVFDVGPEANRQAVEKFLVENKGYERKDIAVDMDISLEVSGKTYKTKLDLVVFVDNKAFMVIKCAAGSLWSREREVVYAARVAQSRPIPVAVASDGHSALVFDAVTRKSIGRELESIPSPEQAKDIIDKTKIEPLPGDRLEKEKIIFRSYDIMNVNIAEIDCKNI